MSDDLDDTPVLSPALQDIEKHRRSGNSAFQFNQYKRAIKEYTFAIQAAEKVVNDRTHADNNEDTVKLLAALFSNRAAAYLRLQQFPKAVEDTTTALTHQPDNLKAGYRLGTAMMMLERYSNAAKAFSKTLKYNPHQATLSKALARALKGCDAESAKERGNADFANRDFDSAIRNYTKGIDICTSLQNSDISLKSKEPSAQTPFTPPFLLSASLYSNRAAAYMKKRMFEPAVEDARQAIKQHPQFLKAYYRLGTALEKLSFLHEAHEAYLMGLSLDPNHSQLKLAASKVSKRITDNPKLSKASQPTPSTRHKPSSAYTDRKHSVDPHDPHCNKHKSMAGQKAVAHRDSGKHGGAFNYHPAATTHSQAPHLNGEVAKRYTHEPDREAQREEPLSEHFFNELPLKRSRHHAISRVVPAAGPVKLSFVNYSPGSSDPLKPDMIGSTIAGLPKSDYSTIESKKFSTFVGAVKRQYVEGRGHIWVASKDILPGTLLMRHRAVAIAYDQRCEADNRLQLATNNDLLCELLRKLTKEPQLKDELLELFPPRKEVARIKHGSDTERELAREASISNQDLTKLAQLVHMTAHAVGLPHKARPDHNCGDVDCEHRLQKEDVTRRLPLFYPPGACGLSVTAEEENTFIHRTGRGLFPEAALLSHSCWPNCVRQTAGDRMEIRAIRPIKKGGEVLDAYINIAQTRADRQRELKDKYGFECTCSRCTGTKARHLLGPFPFDGAKRTLLHVDKLICGVLCPFSSCRSLMKPGSAIYSCTGIQSEGDDTKEQDACVSTRRTVTVESRLTRLENTYQKGVSLFHDRDIAAAKRIMNSLVSAESFLSKYHTFMSKVYIARAEVASALNEKETYLEFCKRSYETATHVLPPNYPLLVTLCVRVALACPTATSLRKYLNEAVRMHHICFGGGQAYFLHRYPMLSEALDRNPAGCSLFEPLPHEKKKKR